MKVRVITLRYSESLQGFPEETIWRAANGMEILSSREHFFTHGGVPHLILLLELAPAGARQERAVSPREGVGAAGATHAGQTAKAEDPALTLPAEILPLYRDLKDWRNNRAKELGVPSYVLSRNAQLAEVCLRQPKTLSELKELEGYGEATVAKYGQEILDRLPKPIAANHRPTAASNGSAVKVPVNHSASS